MTLADESDDDVRSDVVKRAYQFWKIASAAEDSNRRRGLKALEFAQGGDAQWDTDLLSTRQLDARPSESYNQIPNFVNQVVNDGRMNMPQTRFIAGEDGEEETAEKMEDLARNIQSQSDAEIAYDNALYGQTVPGWGYWRYVTEYENDKSFDQIIRIKPVWNQFTVYDDPFAIEVDKLDRKKLIQICDVKLEEFNDEYKSGEDDEAYDSATLESIGDSAPEWATGDTLRIAEYWELTEKPTKLYRNKKTLKITSERPKDLNNYDSRDVLVPKVMWYKINAREVLDKKEWPGIYIPYVKVVGNEVNINGQNIISGMVERLIPAQKQMNYWLNAATEAMALAPKSPWVVDPRAIGPFQSVWDQANVRNFSYLPALSSTSEGQELRAPQRADNSTNLNGFVVMVQQAQQNFYNLSGIYPASLGQTSNEKSGKAILARQKEGDVSTFHIQDNMARGQRAGGRILADLMPKVYDGARKVTGRKEDGSTYIMPINQKYKDGDEQKEHDFTVGTYDVAVTTGPSYSTKRTESSEFYNQLIQSFPDAAGIFGDIAIAASDAAGADRAAERMKRAIAMARPGLIEEEGKEKVPPQVQAQLVQQQQQLQQAEQIIQEGAQQIQQLEQQVASKQGELQLKQADLNMKAQQMQLSEADKQRQAEIDAGQYELDAEKLRLEGRKLDLEEMKLQLEAAKGFAQPANNAGLAQSGGEDMGLSREALLAQMQALDEQELAATQQAEIEQQQMAEQQMMEEQRQLAEQERWNALIQSLQGVQETQAAIVQTNQALVQAVMTPKIVTRDANGLVSGVVSASNA